MAARPQQQRPSRITAKLGRLPRDHEIMQTVIHIKEANGELSEPLYTKDVLARLDFTQETLKMVLPAWVPKPKVGLTEEELEELEREEAAAPKFPVCQVINKKAEYDERKQARAKKKEDRMKGMGVTKELEIYWVIAPHDLSTRLRQLKNFLQKGMKVQVSLIAKRKRGSRQASKEQMKQVFEAVKEAAEGIKGVKPYKKQDGNVGVSKQVMLYYEGKFKEVLDAKVRDGDDEIQGEEVAQAQRGVQVSEQACDVGL